MLSIKFDGFNGSCLQAAQCLLAIYRFKLGADSVTFSQDYMDPNQQENAEEAPPTADQEGGAPDMF